MLSELFQIKRPFFVFDCETTGTDYQARIVEIAFELYKPNTAEIIRWRTFVNPEMQIPQGAIDKHGISNERAVYGCRHCGLLVGDHDDVKCPEGWEMTPTFKQLAPRLAAGFSNCDFGGKNIRFDIRVFGAECSRVGVPWSAVGARVIDADRIEHLGEPRDLTSLYRRRVGKDLIGAHGAMADTMATSELIAAQIGQWFPHLPRDLDALHQMQWPGFIDSEGKFKMVDGKAVCTFGKHVNVEMKRIPVDYWRWIEDISNFSPEIKALAREARVGRFPQ